MTQILRQSTAVDVLIGPFVDSTDGYTAETGVSPSVKLSKNGQTLAAKNDATTPVHDADGYYNCELDATDTNTVGTLILSVVGSATSLPVRHEFMVIEEDAYDFLYASGATPDTDVTAILADTNELQTDDIPGAIAALNDPTAAAIADAVWDEATTGHVTSGTFGEQVKTDIDAILVDTAEIGAAGAGLTAVPWNASWDAEVQSEATDALNAYDPPTKAEMDALLTTQMTESYAANGTAPTAAQALFAIHQMLMQFAISGTSITVKQLDNTTTAFTVTLDDGTSPTSAVRT